MVTRPNKSACYFSILTGQIVHAAKRNRELEAQELLRFLGTKSPDGFRIKPFDKGWDVFYKGKKEFRLTLTDKMVKAREEYYMKLLKSQQDAKKEENRD